MTDAPHARYLTFLPEPDAAEILTRARPDRVCAVNDRLRLRLLDAALRQVHAQHRQAELVGLVLTLSALSWPRR